MKPFTILVDFATPAYDETLKLRDALLRKPLGLEFDVEELSIEYKYLHLACYDENFGLLGCLVLTPLENGQIKMRQVAVQENCQRQGIGQLMVKDSEAVAAQKGYSQMVLNARDTAIPFYLKLGYEQIGKEFIEVGIKHFKMQKTIGRNL